MVRSRTTGLRLDYYWLNYVETTKTQHSPQPVDSIVQRLRDKEHMQPSIHVRGSELPHRKILTHPKCPKLTMSNCKQYQHALGNLLHCHFQEVSCKTCVQEASCPIKESLATHLYMHVHPEISSHAFQEVSCQ